MTTLNKLITIGYIITFAFAVWVMYVSVSQTIESMLESVVTWRSDTYFEGYSWIRREIELFGMAAGCIIGGMIFMVFAFLWINKMSVWLLSTRGGEAFIYAVAPYHTDYVALALIIIFGALGVAPSIVHLWTHIGPIVADEFTRPFDGGFLDLVRRSTNRWSMFVAFIMEAAMLLMLGGTLDAILRKFK